jgi:hypothetical protein
MVQERRDPSGRRAFPGLPEQRLNEIIWVKIMKISGFLTQANQFDWQLERGGDAYHKPTLGGSIKLCQYHTGEG